ncbi:MAG: lysophospholipid acyltransferase family protein [Melioribacteraceae bacterium]|nr:lysophospholipid acyltransferase family protein [Melioribacteraceae bacterium]
MGKSKLLYRNFLRLVGNIVLFHLIRLLCATLRIKIENSEVVSKLESENQNFVVAFWHGQMIVPWYLHRDKKFSALISTSKDGEILARVLKKWKYNVERGSSSKKGKEALNILVESAKKGYSIAITPDGPKGPSQEMKAGAVIAAKKSNVPLLLLACAYKNKKILKSWDRFNIPMLFSKCVAIYSEPILINPNLNYDDTNKLINNCQEKLNRMQQKAEEIVSKT